MTAGIHQFLGQFFDIPKLLSLILYRKLSRGPFMKLRAVLRNALQGLEGTLLSELKKLQLTEEEISALDQIFLLLQKALKLMRSFWGSTIMWQRATMRRLMN